MTPPAEKPEATGWGALDSTSASPLSVGEARNPSCGDAGLAWPPEEGSRELGLFPTGSPVLAGEPAGSAGEDAGLATAIDGATSVSCTGDLSRLQRWMQARMSEQRQKAQVEVPVPFQGSTLSVGRKGQKLPMQAGQSRLQCILLPMLD